jgi:hypothetical protein
MLANLFADGSRCLHWIVVRRSFLAASVNPVFRFAKGEDKETIIGMRSIPTGQIAATPIPPNDDNTWTEVTPSAAGMKADRLAQVTDWLASRLSDRHFGAQLVVLRGGGVVAQALLRPAKTLSVISEDKAMQADPMRLSRACCTTQRRSASERRPAPHPC